MVTKKTLKSTVPEEVPKIEPEIEAVQEAEVVQETPTVKPKLDTDIVTVKVLTGTLQFRKGTFQRGAVVEVTRKEATRFGQAVQITEE